MLPNSSEELNKMENTYCEFILGQAPFYILSFIDLAIYDHPTNGEKKAQRASVVLPKITQL